MPNVKLLLDLGAFSKAVSEKVKEFIRNTERKREKKREIDHFWFDKHCNIKVFSKVVLSHELVVLTFTVFSFRNKFHCGKVNRLKATKIGKAS